MGCADCDVHGLNGLALLCHHAATQLDGGELDETQRFDFFELCSECFREINASPPTITVETLSYDACCGMCADAARIRRARARGEADPFFVYERTLWPIDRDALDELRAILLQNFTFPVSAMSVSKREPALWVEPGCYRQPTTISVYGIVETATQDAVTALVRSFFERRTRNQAKLEFIEAMIVEVRRNAEENSESRRHHIERERVLRVETFG